VLGRIAGYELLEEIGRGGMSVVFRARDTRLGHAVAVKILSDELARDVEYRARFLREARAEASLSHPSIATCFAVDEAEIHPPDLIPSDVPGVPPVPKKLYLTMEFVPGSDLSALVGAEPIPIARVLDLVVQIATGLEVAHAAGVVHRDLKPANVRVTPDGRVKIVDFGLAAIIPRPESDTSSFNTSHNHVMGTCHFMAPEQTQGRTTDPRSDLFSLGVIVYLLVTGKLPYTGNSFFEVIDAVKHVDPPPMARYANNVPDELERIVRKLLAKDPESRYQSAHEVRTDLAQLQVGEPRVIAESRVLRRALVFGATAVLVLVAVGLAWYLLYRPWRALAVVPLVNRTEDPRLDYLGAGIASDLISSLVRGSNLSVAALSTVQTVDSSKWTARGLARELGVGATLTGSLRKRDEVLHLDMELVEGRNGFVLWAAGYDYDLDAGGDVERQIVRDVVHRLSSPFEAEKASAPRPTRPRVGSAYECVLRARSVLDDPDDKRAPERALGFVAQALGQDPEFALAWACRSMALWKLWNRDKQEESLRLAEEAADRALHLDPELLEARLARAQVYRQTSRYADSIRELTGILRVNPNWDEAELQLAAAYREKGDLEQAEAHCRHATEVRPDYWRNWNSLGLVLFLRGKYPEAREAYGRVIQLAPEMNMGYTQLAMVEISDGHYDAAFALYDKLPKPVQDAPTAANIGTAYFFKHRLEEAGRFYALAAKLAPRDLNVWVNLGDLDTRAGRPDSARVHYARALESVEDQLHLNPRNGRLHVQRVLCLAKLGRCGEVHAALAAGADTLAAGNADLAHQLAKVYALCGSRAEALPAVRRAVELGASPAVLRDDDEFKKLVSDPAFPKAPAHRAP
jgi:tetratricopeptide (TPR) repeat protein/TolB-like protein